MRLIGFRWKRWLAAAVALLAVYALAGFWLAPLLVRHQIPRFVHDQLARQAAIGDVSFNPFTLRLEARDIRLDEASGDPLLAIDILSMDLQWRSLVQRAWSFAAIRIEAPRASLVVGPDGKFNLAELLSSFKRRPEHDSKESGMPRVVIDHLSLAQGKVDLRDQQAGYSNQFSPIDFTVSNFSTLPDQQDSHVFSAQSKAGGKLRWKGQASVNPLRASGEVTLENASLPELGAYLKSYVRATVAAGQLSATLPYVVSYEAGKLQASLAGARVSLRDLALAREGATDSFAALTRLELSGIDADLARRTATVAEVRADGGKLSVTRDAKGQLDLASLMAAAAGPGAAAGPAVTVNNWKLAVKQLVFDNLALNAVDETVSPPLRLAAGELRMQLQLDAAQTGPDLQLTLANAGLAVSDLSLSSGQQTPFRLGQLAFTDGSLDLAKRHVSAGRIVADTGTMQVTRDRAGKLNLLALLPKFDATGGEPWLATAKSVELGKFGAEVSDAATGVKVHVSDLAVKLDGVSSDMQRAVKFDAGFSLREGGQFSARGNVVPATGALQSELRIRQLALAPLQPLLAQYLKLKITGGSVMAQGRLTSGGAGPKSAGLRYVGGAEVVGLALNEVDGDPFASWKSVAAGKVSASLNPNVVEIPELRIVEADAKLIIENDRSFNAARLLVARPAAAATAESTPFKVGIGRVRLQDAKLDFTDLSLRPQFSAKVYALNGVIDGLSSSPDSRSRIELDGRVDEFGLARARGELNPFAPADNTDVNVIFKNVDMVPASPYTMKFAGYRIAEGRISLDLQYKVRKKQLEGSNQIVIDKLLLGERVDSPDALKLPIEFAIAILKDSDGRIDLGLPVSGNLDDPQFSYGSLIAKALGVVIGKIVTAPFRALGALLGGGGGEKLEAIDFDPGSARVLPPEREKLKQVAQLLSKRAQLKLSVPGQYNEAADGAALKVRSVRMEIARRAGIVLPPGDEPGPMDLGDGAVRKALREMYAQRFGDAGLDQQRKVADPNSLYIRLQEGLEQNQPLAADALAALGAQRSAAILAALGEAGADATRAAAAAPEKIVSDVGKPVPLKLGLAVK